MSTYNICLCRVMGKILIWTPASELFREYLVIPLGCICFGYYHNLKYLRVTMLMGTKASILVTKYKNINRFWLMKECKLWCG